MCSKCYLLVSILFWALQLYALEGGPASSVWRSVGFPVKILQINGERVTAVDWLMLVHIHQINLFYIFF